MTTIAHDWQRSYVVGGDFTLPDVAVMSSEVHEVFEQDAVALDGRYFDTAQLDLLRAQVTLRWRHGGVDDGWRLKIGDDDVRTAVAEESAGDSPPPDLKRALIGLTRDRALVPIAAISLKRDTHALADADGVVLASVFDDLVEASSLLPESPQQRLVWREVEVRRNATDNAELAEAIDTSLVRAGAELAESHTKLWRLFGTAGPAESSTSADAVILELRRCYLRLAHADIAVRLDCPAEDDIRRAVRDLRDLLRIFGDLFDPGRTRVMMAELRWFHALVSEASRFQSLAPLIEHAVAQVAAADAALAAADAERHLRELAENRRAQVVAALSGGRYLRLLADLADWCAAPPFSRSAAQVPTLIVDLLDQARARRTRKFRRAEAQGRDPVALGELRRAVRRAELAERVGTRAGLCEPSAKRTQAADQLLAALRELRRNDDSEALLATLATASPTHGFCYGLACAELETRTRGDGAGVLAAAGGRL